MYRIAVRLVMIATFVLALSARAADWPRFRGPNGDGIAPATVIDLNWSNQPPTVLWTVPLSDRGFAGPAAADGMVFIVDHHGDQDVVRALDIHTGSNVWTHPYPDDAKEAYGFARATPAIDHGKVYTVSRLGLVNCLDEKTGTPVWSKNVVAEFQGQIPEWKMAWSPLVDGDKLIVLPGGKDAAVVALNKLTGQTIWRGGGSDKPGYSTPVAATINGTKQYVVFTGVRLIGVDAAAGRELWQVPWQTSYDVNAAMPIVVGNTVFITSGYGHGGALITVGPQSAAITWQTKELTAHFNSPICTGGYVYGIGDPGNLVCLELASGKLMWKQSGFEKGGVVGVQGALIALAGNNGQAVLVEMTPTGYHELGRIKPLSGQSWTAPIVAEGKLIVRNKESLACVTLPPGHAK